MVTLLDRDGLPVLGARVALADGRGELQTGRTHADGRALLFPLVTARRDAASYDVRVGYAGAEASTGIGDRGVREHEVRLDVARPEGPVRLDLHFLVDTTGSMADDFADLVTFRDELEKVSAGGGGDTPEALDEALHGALDGPAWDSDRAVQIAFLLADASPHLGGASSGPSYTQDVQVAAEKGVEVVPLASSGTDDPAEYVFRQLAQYSLGTFFFLTYGADGRSPGDGTDRDVSGYETGSLEELVAKHVAARLAARDGRGRGQ